MKKRDEKGRLLCESCTSRAVFGFITKQPRRCSTHKEEKMRDVVNKMCSEPDCEKRATCGQGGTPTKCRQHDPTSPDKNNKLCEIKGCSRYAVYGIGKAVWCSEHKIPGSVNVKASRCAAEGCKSLRPGFGFPGEKGGKRCSTHRLEGMIDLCHPLCPAEGCLSNGNPKYDGYCVHHFMTTFPDDPRTANAGRSEAEVRVEAWLNQHPMVRMWNKAAIQVDTGKMLFPDALVELINGHRILIECDGP